MSKSKIEVNGERTTIDDYLSSLPLEEIHARHATLRAQIEDIDAQIDREAIKPKRGADWLRKARAAQYRRRIEAQLLLTHLTRAEKQARFERHWSGVPEARLIALERSREVLALMVERDEAARDQARTKAQLFFKAASEILPRETFLEILREAEALEPNNPCWRKMEPLSNGEREAIKRARRLRAELSAELDEYSPPSEA